MPTDTITCPNCDTALRSATAFPVGKKVKCPKCATIFVVPGGDEEAADGVRSRVRPAAPGRKAPPRDDPDDAPDADEEVVVRRRPGKRRPADEEDEEEQVTARKPARRPRAAEEDEDFDDEDDRPRRRRGRGEDEDEEEDDRPRRRKKAQKGRGKSLVLILSIGGGVLLLGLFALGAWVWPGFLKSGGSSGGPAVPAGATFTDGKDMLVFLPTSSKKVMGVDIAALRKETLVANNLERMTAQSFFDPYSCNLGQIPAVLKKLTGKDYKDSCDYLVIGHFGVASASKVAVLKTSVDFKVEDLARELNGRMMQLQGKNYYTCWVGDFTNLYMPSPRLLVMTNAFVPPAELPSIFFASGPPAILKGDFQTAFTKAAKSHFWKFEDQKDKLAQLENLLKFAQGNPQLESKKPLLDAMLQAKPTLEVTCVTVGSNEVSYASWAVCTDEASAGKMRSAAEEVSKTMTDQEVRVAATPSLPSGPNKNRQVIDALVKEAKETSKYVADKNMVGQTYRLGRANYDATMFKK
jgi:hypothetical protein